MTWAMLSRLSRTVAPACLLFALAGCGGGGDAPLPRFPTKGTITMEGVDLTGLMVNFTPVPEEGQGLTKAKPASGMIGPGGAFELSTIEPKDGANKGKYKVTITGAGSMETLAAEEERLKKIPAVYRDFTTSPLEVNIVEGPVNELPLVLDPNARSSQRAPGMP